MENQIEIKDSWTTIKKKLKQKFAILSDTDLLLAEGKQDEMMARLKERLGRTEEELLKLIHDAKTPNTPNN